MGSLWNRSGTVERYADDLRAIGAKAYFYQGGTTTPLTVYQDSGEAASHEHPVVTDANGRWPDVFVPYVTGYDVQVLSPYDTLLSYSIQIPNPDPVELTVTVDPSNTVQTGMTHFELVNTTKPGYVRLNGKTMGNAASGGTERANPDTQALFIYLWNNLTNAVAPVLGGRGASAASDFAANKHITLPNLRGGIPVGLDDMGDVPGGFFTGLTFALGSATLPGSTTGQNSIVLVEGNFPLNFTLSGTTADEDAHTHTGATGVESVPHTHSGTTGAGSPHQHDAFIFDPQHNHTQTAGTNFITASVASGQGAAGANHAVGSLNPASTGVRVKSSLPGAADDKTALESVHTHPFTSGNPSAQHTHSFTSNAGTPHSHTFTTNPIGAGTPLNNLPRSVLVTWFIKL